MKSGPVLLTVLLALSLAPAPRAGAQDSDPLMQIRLLGASRAAGFFEPRDVLVRSYLLAQNAAAPDRAGVNVTLRGAYREVFPGIDLYVYGDDYCLEYVFTVAPGGDVSRIAFELIGPEGFSINEAGSLLHRYEDCEIIQSPPVIFEQTEDAAAPFEEDVGLPFETRGTVFDGQYDIGPANAVRVRYWRSPEMDRIDVNGHRFNLVPGGGQPGGPSYSFYISKFEVTNNQFLRFLNDAQAATNTARGANMFFDEDGNVWLHPAKQPGRDEMFRTEESALLYDSGREPGDRYRLRGDEPAIGRHPIAGVSWFGAVKYCNWLTILSGRGLAERCYTEGTNRIDWAPVTATNWPAGVFTDAERVPWLSRKGFRLPMVDSRPDALTTNDFDEFYKAAAWDAVTNRLYAYGRDVYTRAEANFTDAGERLRGESLPVNFFDGENSIGEVRTRQNLNYYGVADLNGNVREWLNDPVRAVPEPLRFTVGGAWNESAVPTRETLEVEPPHAVARTTGFRPITTFLPLRPAIVYILFCFYCGVGEGIGVEMPAEAAEVPAEEVVAEERPGITIEVSAPAPTSDYVVPEGLIYKFPPQPGVPPIPTPRPPSPVPEVPVSPVSP